MEIENKPSSARDFVDKMCVKSDKYATSLSFIMCAYMNFCREKDAVPSTTKKVARILQERGVRVIRGYKGQYYCIELKGYKIGRELINNIDV